MTTDIHIKLEGKEEHILTQSIIDYRYKIEKEIDKTQKRLDEGFKKFGKNTEYRQRILNLRELLEQNDKLLCKISDELIR